MKQKTKQKEITKLQNLPPLPGSTTLLFFLALFILSCSTAFGSFPGSLTNAEYQDGKIRVSGEVRDKTGETIPGVNVFEKGTTNGTITGIDGRYTLEVFPTSTLVFSFVGYRPNEVLVASQTVINSLLEQEVLGLDEVVVTAMGIRSEKRRLNFAVQSVDSEDLNVGRQTNFVDALQGRIAGIEVSGTGGSPSASSQILIRGISSINPAQNNEPIFILNGMHVSGGASKAAEINPNDIENVTVLKGAAAAALYGQEASNGAIIITPNRGKKGSSVSKPVVLYRSMKHSGFPKFSKCTFGELTEFIANSQWEAGVH
jgi:TonB-dependent SusC/RagA subfamily outer membrane receptor